VDTGCEVLATGCPACMIHISDMLSKSGDKIKVKHTIEIYSESLKESHIHDNI
jgi:glycolate oxidase iron-sulfur subunit